MDLKDFIQFAFVKFGLKEVTYLAGQDKQHKWHILSSRVKSEIQQYESSWEQYSWSDETFSDREIVEQPSFKLISEQEAFSILL